MRYSLRAPIMVAVAAISVIAMQAHAANEHFVEIVAFKFSPQTVQANVGDTITWINRDIVPHTATAYDESMDTGEIKQSESKSITVTTKALLKYFCRYHPGMQGEIAVE